MDHKNAFLSWLPLAITITGFCVLIYAVAQQQYRQSLNDPQVQIAEDAARLMQQGASPAELVPRGQLIDVVTSLAPFISVYDESYLPLESTGVIHGNVPLPPKGVFQAAASPEAQKRALHGENRVTWQPATDARIALVVVYVPGKGYVASGRNMREGERRIGELSTMIGLTWILLLIASFAAYVLSRRFA